MTSSRDGHAGSRQRFRETDVPLTLERFALRLKRRTWIPAPAHSARVQESGCAVMTMPHATVRGTSSSRDARPNLLSRRSASQTCNKPGARRTSLQPYTVHGSGETERRVCFVGFSRFSSHAHVYRRASCLMSGLLHVWEAERRNRRFGRASRELDVPCLLYTSPSPRDLSTSRMPSSA